MSAAIVAVWQLGIDQGVWGKRLGEFELVNQTLAPQYIMKKAEQFPIIEDDDDKVYMKVYDDGVIVVSREVVDHTMPGGKRTVMVWLPKVPISSIIEDASVETMSHIKLASSTMYYDHCDVVSMHPADEDGWYDITRQCEDGCVIEYQLYTATGETRDYYNSCSNSKG